MLINCDKWLYDIYVWCCNAHEDDDQTHDVDQEHDASVNKLNCIISEW